MRLTEFIESTRDFKTILTTIRDQKNQLLLGLPAPLRHCCWRRCMKS